MELTGNAVLGWGYEGKSVDDLLTDAQRWSVTTVVDVRLNPISRKRGLSKTALRSRLEESDVAYLHLPALGNPKDNRAGFAEPGTALGESARERFVAEILSTGPALAALAAIEDSSLDGRVLLLCFEASERCCHRSLVLDALRARASDRARSTLAAV